MRPIVNCSFENMAFPADWLVETATHSFEQGVLRSGRVTHVKVPLPGHAWRRVRVEIEAEPAQGMVLGCGDGTNEVVLKVKEKEYVRHAVMKQQLTLKETFDKVPDKPGFREVVFEFEESRVRGLVDGVEYVAAADPAPQPLTGWVHLHFWNDCLVRRVRILADGEQAAPLFPLPPRPRARRAGDFVFEMAVDFYDDLIAAPFSRAMYGELFDHFAECGVRRVRWNYHDKIYQDRMAVTNEADIGDNFELAVETAHARGIEIFGLIKPLEGGYFDRWLKGAPEARFARKPAACGKSQNKLVTRVDLVKEDDRPCAFTVQDLALYVSDDNRTYRLYEGPIIREEVIEDYPVYVHRPSGVQPGGETRRSRVMRFKNLRITNEYVALSVKGNAWSFANTPANLVHLFGENGEDRFLTYGAQSQTDDSGQGKGFERHGVSFDYCPWGVPTASTAGADAVSCPFILDFREGFIAVRREKGRFYDLLSPAFAQSREAWLSWVRAIHDAGGDGVELRIRNHCGSFTWTEFGFEQPVRDEFLKRHGVDIWATDDFDQAAWRRLRGEEYTDFIREARKVSNSAGKPLGLHVEVNMDFPVEINASMNIEWDWRTWLKEGLADTVTMKEIWPRTRFAQEVLSLARPRGTRLIFCPYANGLPETAGRLKVIEGWIRAAREGGFDGYQFYECASLFRGTPEGRVIMPQPELKELFRREFPPG